MNRYSPADVEVFVNRLYQGAPVQIVPYCYPMQFVNLATTGASSTQTQTLSITANADFIFMAAYYHAVFSSLSPVSQTSANRPIAAARVLIVDTGTNEQFSNSPVDLEAFCMNGNIDNVAVYPRLVQGRTALTVTMTGYSNQVANEAYALIDFTLSGVLVRALSR